jgi:hypothetical protein
MNSSKPQKSELPDGGPLAVCINDCQLDYGQRRSELAAVCFQVCCAFAEMRWGNPPAILSVVPLETDDNHPPSPR